jgi:glutamyl-tRNA reductase
MESARLFCLGLSHSQASVEVRERFRCSLDALAEVHRRAGVEPALAHYRRIREFALLSTCNRFELYATVDPSLSAEEGRELLCAFIAAANDAADGADAPFYCYLDVAAMRHLSRVATGLDSLVLGESQILGQVIAAYTAATEAHTLGPFLDEMMLGAIRAGKRARRETAIGHNPASISSVAIALARQASGPLRDKRIVVVGLGEMGSLTLKALAARKLTHISVVNRTPERAAPYIAQGHAAYALDQLDEALLDADIVVSATSAEHFILTADDVEALQGHRNGRPLTLVDIALPRDIEPAATAAQGVQLFDIDDLNAGLDEALASRREEVPKVEAIIEQEASCFAAMLAELAMRPVVVDLRQRAEQIRQQELARTLRYMGDDIDDEVVAQLNHLSRSLVNRLLHSPTLRLREVAHNGQADAYAAAIRDLFDLSEMQDLT